MKTLKQRFELGYEEGWYEHIDDMLEEVKKWLQEHHDSLPLGDFDTRHIFNKLIEELEQ